MDLTDSSLLSARQAFSPGKSARTSGGPAETWRLDLSRMLGVAVTIEAPDALKVAFTHHRLGALETLTLACSPHDIASAGGGDAAVIWIKLEGSGSLRQGAQHAELPENAFCIFEMDKPFAARVASESRDLLILLPAKTLRNALPNWQDILLTPIPAAQGPAAIFIDLVKSVARHGDSIQQECAGETADAAVSALVAALRSLPQGRRVLPSPLEIYHRDRIRNFVREQVRDPSLSMESVAQAMGLSRRYIHRLFAKETAPLMKWVWSERLDHCSRDLGLCELRNRTISEIAFFWGFNNAAHFSRSFHQRFGMPPSEFRKRALSASAPAPHPGK